MNEEIEELFKTLSTEGEAKLFEMLSKDKVKIREHNKLIKSVTKKLDSSINALNIALKISLLGMIAVSAIFGWSIYNDILSGKFMWIILFVVENIGIFVWATFFINGIFIKNDGKHLYHIIKNLEIIKDGENLHFKGELDGIL